MRIDRLSLKLRQRSPWEAADLGMALARQHYGRIQRAFFAFALPWFVLLNALGYALDQVWIAGLALWWMKPWFDQLVLDVIARAVFDDPPRTRDTLKRQFRLAAIWPWLLWRRLDPTRALSIPVAVLEGLRGKERRARSGLLGQASNGTVAGALCLVLLHIEIALGLSVFLLALMFVPYDFLGDAAQQMFDTLVENPPRLAQVLVNLVSLFAMAVVEPLFVGAGFGLYLNRRTELEAWDIELAFRRIARRLATPAAIVLLGLLTLPGVAGKAMAAEISDSRSPAKVFVEPSTDATFADEIATTLESPTFGKKQTLYRLERIGQEQEPIERFAPEWLNGLAGIFSFAAESVLWIVIGILLIAVLVFALRRRSTNQANAPASATVRAPQVNADPALDPGASELLDEANRLFANGAPRKAMALIYQGARSCLHQRLASALPPGATEATVMRLAHRLVDQADRDALIDIVRHWQLTAYADRPPDAERFDQLVQRFAQLAWRPT